CQQDNSIPPFSL
nr:immunoglobulin light chain junction region [Macaca mulatta]